MIVIITTDYYFLQPLIKKLNLKKNNIYKYYDIYENNEIKVIITYKNTIKYISGLSYIISKISENEDLCIFSIEKYEKHSNIERNKLIIINEIYDDSIQEYFYPDMIFDIGIAEKNIICKKNNKNEYNDFSSIFYQTANTYVGPHKLYIFKECNSDKNYIEDNNVLILYEFIKYINKKNLKYTLNNEENINIKVVSTNLKLTEYQKNILKNKCITSKIKGRNITNILKEYQKKLVNNKNERKKTFNELLQKL